MKKRILVSVSGGESSGLMAVLMHKRFSLLYDLVFVFANTSREKEKTLIFVKKLTDIFNIPIVWVEAIVNPVKRKGTTHKIVSFETAKRKGEVFEEVIKKYGIPNKKFPHCTRELKTRPIQHYMRSQGWGDFLKYSTAIGYRADEPKRATKEKEETLSQMFPLKEWGINKPDVAFFWGKQTFKLDLAEEDGNCNKCWKKTDRKIMKQIVTDPQDVWVDDMENKYKYNKAGRKAAGNGPYLFFRDNQSIQDYRVRIASGEKIFEQIGDRTAGHDPDLDYSESGCEESCEPF